MKTPTDDHILTDRPDYDYAKKSADRVLQDNLVTSPPVNIFAVVRNYGLEVTYADFGGHSDVAGFVDLEARHIVVNSLDPPSRQKFTVAHELGHWIMHRQLLKENPDRGILLRLPLGMPDPDPREKEANSFAANILVPDEFVLPVIQDGQRMTDLRGGERLLATVFGVSSDVVVYRLRQLNAYSS